MPYVYSPERLEALKAKVKDAEPKRDAQEAFANVYQTMSLKETAEYFDFKIEDVYILVHYWGIPLNHPKLAHSSFIGPRKPQTINGKRDYRRFVTAKGGNKGFSFTKGESLVLDYDKLAALVAENLIRLVVSGWVAQQRQVNDEKIGSRRKKG